jgi:hypothetical protein
MSENQFSISALENHPNHVRALGMISIEIGILEIRLGQMLGAIIGIDTDASLKSRLMSDEHAAYKLVGWNFASHDTVNHERKEFARGEASTNTIEGMFSILKRGLYGTYQRVSEDHLQRYLCEFDFRYSNRGA